MVNTDNYKKALIAFVEGNNDIAVTLFAVLKMDELMDKWSVVVALEWAGEEDRRKLFASLIKAIQENLTSEQVSEIARVAFYKPDEHLIELFLEKYDEGQRIKEDAQINGNIIHEGYIIALKKENNAIR